MPDPLEVFHKAFFPDEAYVAPRSGKCIFCSKDLTIADTDHSVCNKCWTATFACPTCGDESGDCEHDN